MELLSAPSLHAATTCHRCGGSRAILATSHRGHGDFTRGGAHYAASSFEIPTPATHCCCPDGPCWAELRRSFAPEEQAALRDAERCWDRGLEAIRIPMGGSPVDLTPRAWRDFCIQRAAGDAPLPTEAPAPQPQLPRGLDRPPVVVSREGGRILWAVELWLARSGVWRPYRFSTARHRDCVWVTPITTEHAVRKVRRHQGAPQCSCSDFAAGHPYCVHTALAELHEREEPMSPVAEPIAMPEEPAEAPPIERSITPPAVELLHVPHGQVTSHPNNVRKQFDPDKLRELAESIAAQGILEPLLVRTLPEGRWVIDPTRSGHFLVLDMQRVNKLQQSYDGVPERYDTAEDAKAHLPRYELVAGERRWRAAAIAGLATVPIIVRDDMSDEDVLSTMLSENVQRADLSPVELARGVRDLMALGLNQTRIGQRIGLSQESVSQTLALLRLPEPVQELIDAGRLTKSHGRRLLTWAEFPDYLTFVARRCADAGDPLSTLDSPAPYSNHAAAAKLVQALDYQTPFDRSTCRGCDALTKPGVYGDPVCLRPACYLAKVEEDQQRKREEAERVAAQAREAGAAWLKRSEAPAASPEAPRTEGEQAPASSPEPAPAPQLPELDKLQWNSYEVMPDEKHQPAGCKGDACPSMGMAVSHGGSVVRVCFDGRCAHKLKTAQSKAAAKALKQAAKDRWAQLVAATKSDPEPTAQRTLARIVARKLQYAPKGAVEDALAMAGVRWDARLFSGTYRMNDGPEIWYALSEGVPLQALALMLGALDAREEFAALMQGNRSDTPAVDWALGLTGVPSLEKRAAEVYRYLPAEQRLHVNAIRASAGLPPLPEPPDPDKPTSPAPAPEPPDYTDAPDPSGLSYSCAGCGGALASDQVGAFTDARAADDGAVLRDDGHPDVALHIPSGLAVDADGALYCPTCSQSILPDLWAERAARLAELAPAELAPGDEADPEEGDNAGAEAPRCCSCGNPIPDRWAAAWARTSDEAKLSLFDREGSAVLVMETGERVTKAGDWYCRDCGEATPICVVCGNSAITRPGITWVEEDLCRACAAFAAVE